MSVFFSGATVIHEGKVMDKSRLPVRFYVPLTLLCFLLAKLVFAGLFFYSERSAAPVPILKSRLALAKGTEATTGEDKTEGSSLNTEPLIPPTGQDRGIRLKALEAKRLQIEQERRLLQEEQKQLTALKQEINQKLSRLTKVQDAIQARIAEQQTRHDKRIKHLIKIYTTMPPKKAATLIEKLDMEVIIALFSRMKGEKVGQILPYVVPDKAARIVEKLARQD